MTLESQLQSLVVTSSLTASQKWLMTTIIGLDGPLRPRWLARVCSCTVRQLRQQLSVLVKLGVIERVSATHACWYRASAGGLIQIQQDEW